MDGLLKVSFHNEQKCQNYKFNTPFLQNVERIFIIIINYNGWLEAAEKPVHTLLLY